MTSLLYELEQVKQVYGSRTVLSIPALQISRGEIFALIGPSGAGKSTLLRLLALLEAPSSGSLRLHLDDRIVTCEDATLEDRRRVAMVFQRPVLLSRSVRQNIAYGLRLRGKRDSREQVEAMLERVSMLPLADARPHTLSGGEVQRVSLARAMILEPDILLLDEPTANLDRYNVSTIEALIRDQHARQGTTIILITHNIFQARRLATRMALLLDGELVEVGPTETLCERPQDPRTAAFVSGDLVY